MAAATRIPGRGWSYSGAAGIALSNQVLRKFKRAASTLAGLGWIAVRLADGAAFQNAYYLRYNAGSYTITQHKAGVITSSAAFLVPAEGALIQFSVEPDLVVAKINGAAVMTMATDAAVYAVIDRYQIYYFRTTVTGVIEYLCIET